MGATVAFTDLGTPAGAGFPNISDLADQQLHLETEIGSEHCFEDIVGRSPALQKVLDQVAIVAPTDSTVLLHGETGTGKELIARAIHRLSSRRGRALVRMNCAAIPSGLLESELFGHEKGAFTGALLQRKGRFELADGGSLFLDEIGDISLELQPKLLRAIQEQEFERLGSARTIQVNVRMIAATHRNLAAMIREQEFREDLFYRFNVFPIEIPPLRERREDIPLLVNHFVSKFAQRMGKDIKLISRGAMDALTHAPWKGNVRELGNFMERCVILTQGNELNVPHLDSAGRKVVPVASSFREAERRVIIDALGDASGRIAGKGGAAERLGLKRTTLQNKMRRLSIGRSDYSADQYTNRIAAVSSRGPAISKPNIHWAASRW
jgi:formate hydrogenlyase transcriptional activator